MDEQLGSRRLTPHLPQLTSRRELLFRAGTGFGTLALATLLAEDGWTAPVPATEPAGSRPAHFRGRAKSVIWLFMEGGPSHIDLFDPKPELERLAGKPLPESFGRPTVTAMGTAENELLPSKRAWKQYGESGIPVSDWYPNIAQHVDEMTVLRSCWADGLNHVGSVCQMNTGAILAGRPSLGAWVTYGIGSANRNLPTFVILLDEREPIGGGKNWSAGFLPASFQGTQFRPDKAPILAVAPPPGVNEARQREKLDLIAALNRHHRRARGDDGELEARIRAYELAFRMQAHAPEAVDLTQESEATRRLYGIGDPVTDRFGTNCLLARRLVERGVRFVQLYCGTGSQWDAHADLEGTHTKMCAISDRPIAGLLTDLKQRGLLDETLVIWGGEFGRTPMSEKTKGRDHNPWGFTIWLAGGGAKRGQIVGATDAVGLRAVETPVHVHDIHATILHLLGLDHVLLTYRHNGRDERATVNGGKVVRELIA